MNKCSSMSFTYKNILKVVLVGAVLLYIILQPNVFTGLKLKAKSGQSDECPSLKGHKTTEDNLLGLDPEIKTALRCRFKERSERLRRTCAKTGPFYYSPSVQRKRSDGRKTFLKMNLTLCSLQKVGSMFWHRFFNLYMIIYGTNFKSVETDTLLTQDYRSTTKIVFVRDPYSRLLSGYMDKLFSTNPEYWVKMGSDVVHNFRFKGRASDQHKGCGTDVTFAEFVEYILNLYENDINMDRHFRPIQYFCEFCKMDYDYVGKMETFLDDMVYVSDAIGALRLNKTRKYIYEHGFKGAEKIMLENVGSVFHSRLKKILNCGVSLHQALKITWRRWMIRGLIETRFHFPFKADDVNITVRRFYEAGLAARAISDKRKLRESKKEALRSAYSTLSVQTKIRLRDMFLPQFEMFGYDSMPDVVFGEYDKRSDSFDYFEKETIFDSN